MISGITKLAITKLDVLDGLKNVKICTGYQLNGKKIDFFPANIEQVVKCKPLYEEFEGWNKINAAYVYGGTEMVKQEILELTGIDIDRVMILNFNGFKRVIDILGGVRIVVDEPLHDPLSGADFEPGEYLMDGEQALSFARCRSTARADLDRMDRQQYLLNELIKQKANFSTISKILNPFNDASDIFTVLNVALRYCLIRENLSIIQTNKGMKYSLVCEFIL